MEKPKDKPKDKTQNKTMAKVLILMGVGFVIDVGQAIVVYNAGKGAEAKAVGQVYKWKFPTGKELLKTVALVFVTSALTGLMVSGLEIMLLSKEEKEPISA